MIVGVLKAHNRLWAIQDRNQILGNLGSSKKKSIDSSCRLSLEEL